MMLDFEKLFKKEYVDINSLNILALMDKIIDISSELNDKELLLNTKSFKEYISNGNRLCLASIDVDTQIFLKNNDFHYLIYLNNIFFKETDFEKFKMLLVKYNICDIDKQISLLENEKNLLNKKLKMLTVNNKEISI